MEKNKFFEPLVTLTLEKPPEDMLEKTASIIGDNSFNWDAFLAVCFKQKVAGLVFDSVNRLGLEDLVSHRTYNILRHFYFGNASRNEVILSWVDRICMAGHDEGIDLRPLKGAILIPCCYRKNGVRCLNDIDFFVAKENRGKVEKLMKSLGFRQGHFSRSRREIKPFSKEENLLWKMKMFNLPPFRRLVDSEHIDVVNVDFAYGISYFENSSIDEEMISRFSNIEGIRTLEEVDFFIHLCCHLHKEATNEAWVSLSQDVNLIKFCDVHRFFYSNILGVNEREVVIRARELGVAMPVYFAIKHCADIYSDKNLRLVSDRLQPSDEGELNSMYRQGNMPVSKRKLSVIDQITNI